MISKCLSVRLVITGYAEADCTFDNGREEKVWIGVAAGLLPEPTWLVGKTPMQIKKYPPERPASGTASGAGSHHL